MKRQYNARKYGPADRRRRVCRSRTPTPRRPVRSHRNVLAGRRAAAAFASDDFGRRLAPPDRGPTVSTQIPGLDRAPIAVHIAYAAAALLSAFLLLSNNLELTIGSAQGVNGVISAGLMFILSAGAALGLCEFAVVRHTCTFAGIWLSISPLFLPGFPSDAALFVSPATAAVAAWANEVARLCRGDERVADPIGYAPFRALHA